MDFSQTSLFLATQKQVNISRLRMFKHWGRGVTIEEFLKRDEFLGQLPHSADGKWNMWVLASRTDPTSDNFFCSCETFEREAAVSKVAVNTVDASTKHIAYGIAGVFTPPEHRTKGYARHMMRLLHYVLANQQYRTSIPFPLFPKEQWGEPPIIPPGFGVGIASVLYSDVGPSFYKECGIGLSPGTGWIVDRPINTIWQVPEPVTAQAQADDARLQKYMGFSWLTEERKLELWNSDAEMIRKEITSADIPCFSFLPNNAVAQYQEDRSRFFLSTTNTEGIWGAETTTPIDLDMDGRETAITPFITWTLDPGRKGPGTLVVTRLRADHKTFPVLLQAALHAARKIGLVQVEIWNLDPDLAEIQNSNAQGVTTGVTSEREDHLPAIAWYGEGNIQWRYNEKFCWC